MYVIDKTRQLSEAIKKGFGAQAASLRAQGVPAAQHNSKLTRKTAKKSAAKKPAAKKAISKKTVAKQEARKTAVKKAAKNS